MGDNRKRILVVDDSPSNLRILSEILKSEYRLSLARSGEDALEPSVCREADLILLDVMMPGLDGFEVCRRLKADSSTAQIPVLFMSALDPVELAEAAEAGAAGVIFKPFDPADIIAKIRKFIVQ